MTVGNKTVEITKIQNRFYKVEKTYSIGGVKIPKLMPITEKVYNHMILIGIGVEV